MPMKNSSDTTGNRTHDLPDCSTVPQPTAPPRTSTGGEGVRRICNCVVAVTVGRTSPKYGIQPQSKGDVLSSVMPRGVDRCLATAVLGKYIRPKTLEDGTDKLSQNSSNKVTTNVAQLPRTARIAQRGT